MRPQVIQAIRVFLQRVDLKGNEVPAFNAIMAELDAAEKTAAEAFAMQQQAAPPLKIVPDNSPADAAA